MLEADQRAPDFELEGQDGASVRLSDFEGQKVVLYFYPKADTPGCTIEAKDFRDHWAAFEERDVMVLGVSIDTVQDVKAFQRKYDLPFTLLADEDGDVANRYDTFGTVQYGDEDWDIAFRNTYLVDEEGTIERVYEDVTPAGHAEEILADL